MSFEVYDYRTDVRNVLVTPQIRSRFLRLEPGAASSAHTHDLGHEVFLVLQGRALFEIDGDAREVGPGQMCVALADQMHSVRAVGDKPVTMCLSVTPHVQPTHSFWDEDGRRLPHRFAPSSNYDAEPDSSPFAELADRFVTGTRSLADAAGDAAGKEAELAESLKRAVATGDDAAARDARSSMYDALLPVYRLTNELASVWNDLAPRAGSTQ